MLLLYSALCSIQSFLVDLYTFISPLLRYYSTHCPSDHLNVLGFTRSRYSYRRRRYPKQYHLRRRIHLRSNNTSDAWLVLPYAKPLHFSQVPGSPTSPHLSATPLSHDNFVDASPSDVTISDLCDSINFLDLHRVTTIFDDAFLPRSFRDQITSDLNSIRHICYSNSYETFSPTYMSPNNFFLNRLDRHNLPIVLDSGASRSISPVKCYFVSLRKCTDKINGINSSTQVEGIGKMRLKIVDDQNKTAIIETEGYTYLRSVSDYIIRKIISKN